MTREQARKLLPIITAWAEGNNVRFMPSGGTQWVVHSNDELAHPLFTAPGEWEVCPERIERWCVVGPGSCIQHIAPTQGDAQRWLESVLEERRHPYRIVHLKEVE